MFGNGFPDILKEQTRTILAQMRAFAPEIKT